MDKWRISAQDNLLAWSKEKENYLIAAKEWEFTGKIIDHGNSKNRCDLCEGENLRYHFEVKHSLEEKLINVGSSCITKFGLLVRGELGDIITDEKEKIKFLNNKLYEKQRDVYLEQLRNVYRVSCNKDDQKWLEYIGKKIKNDMKFCINEAVDISIFLESKSILLDYHFIKFDTRSSLSIDYLARVDRDYLEKTIKCLPPNQVKSITERLLIKFGLII
jgi:hypothetical protein